eukprot:757422-Hanusia_phi.AAC.1
MSNDLSDVRSRKGMRQNEKEETEGIERKLPKTIYFGRDLNRELGEEQERRRQLGDSRIIVEQKKYKVKQKK